MATAFTPQERDAIRQALVDSAMRRAAVDGMRHVTIEQLASDAGISKGAFYGFFESKEHLYLAVLEVLHDEMYGNARRMLRDNATLPKKQRAALAIAEVCRVLESHRMSGFIRNDVPLLIRHLPKNLLEEHYLSDEEHIRRLLKDGGLRLAVPMDTACTIVRMLMCLLMHRQELGATFADGLRVLCDAACEKIVLE